MRRLTFSRQCGLALLLLAPAALVPASLHAQAPAAFTVRVANSLPIARPDETIAIGWDVVAAKFRGVQPAGVRVIDDASSADVVS